MNKKRFFILFLAALVAAFVYAQLYYSAKAADATNISISPLTFDLAGNPGDSLANEFLIRNSGKDSVVVSIETQDFVATGEEGEIDFTDKSTYSLADWIEVDSQKYTLQGGQQKRAKFIVRIPYKAEPGGHYASVYAHISPTVSGAQSGSFVGQKIGSLVLLRVAGKTAEDAKVASFDTAKDSYQSGPVDFDVRIENTGSVHLKPKGIIAVTNIWGKKVADVTVEQKNVLPGAIRHMTAKWENTPRFGKYTATLLSYYGAENKQLTAATTFWIIPWKFILICTTILIVIAALIYMGRRRLKEAGKALLGKKR